MKASNESFVSAPQGLSPWIRAGAAVAGLIASLFIFGFALFAAVVMRETAPNGETADGIIVLTGGDYRIGEGARLLKEKRAQRMLISGVNPKTGRDDLIKVSNLDTATFACCVDLGYAAQDTIGNAEEAKTWVMGRGVKRLIVVTSNYHMPRSLAELALSLPDVVLIPDAVVPKAFRESAWWFNPMAARILVSEYLKFIPVAARLVAMRYLAASGPASGGGARVAPQ
ncbi:MAG: YdcF family protein [Gammaproteobacteria bacterium]